MENGEEVSGISTSKLQPRFKERMLPHIALALIFLVLVVPLALKSEIDIYDARDEESFHYPTIRDFWDDFPSIDLANYRSATTPLYHIILALGARVMGLNVIPLRLFSALFSLGCLLVFYTYLSKRGDRLKAFFFTALLLFSPYFIGPAIRLSTDNAGLLLALLAIYAMEFSAPTTRNFVLTNVLILAAVWVRQIYVWLLGAYVLFNLRRTEFALEGKTLIRLIWPTLIPIVGLAYFVFLWKGLTPPPFAGHFSYGLNWDVPVFLVSLVGFYGLFFSPWLLQLYRRKPGLLPFIVLMIFAAGYLLLHPVSNEYPLVDGSIFYRGGALWLIASRLPNFIGSALLFWVLFPLGLAFLYLMARYLASRREHLIMICFALWLTANITNKDTYQKYYEPLLFFFMGYVLVTIETKGEKYAWIGPMLLMAGFMGIAVTRFFG
jgi:hypothetical protein